MRNDCNDCNDCNDVLPQINTTVARIGYFITRSEITKLVIQPGEGYFRLLTLEFSNCKGLLLLYLYYYYFTTLN